MVSRPRRTFAQTAVAVVVLALLAGGVWLAVSSPVADVPACAETTLEPPAREVFTYGGSVVGTAPGRRGDGAAERAAAPTRRNRRTRPEPGLPLGPPPLTALVPDDLPVDMNGP